MNDSTPSEYEIHAYVDGCLDESRRQAVEFYLAQHPERAEEVRAWHRDAQQLRVLFGAQSGQPDNPMLDPARIRRRRHRRMRARLAVAAMLVLSMGVGGLGGWEAQHWRAAQAAPPMADAMEAYRLMTRDQSAKLDIVSDRVSVLQAWLDRHFAHRVRLPDLQDANYHPVGGRLFATDQGAAAMVFFRDARGRTISFYVRPPGPLRHLLPSGERVDGDLMAQYGSDHVYNYAVVSKADADEKRVAAEALRDAI